MQPEENKEHDYWHSQGESVAVQSIPVDGPDEASNDKPLSWQASEAVHHEKNVLWFAGLAAVVVVLLAISIFVLRSWTFAALIITMAISIVMIGSRPPRVVQYQLSSHGVQVNERLFKLSDFRAFGVLEDGPLYSIVLIPRKRFMPGVNVYFPAENGEKIVDVFGSVLPMEHIEPDMIDKLSRKLRF